MELTIDGRPCDLGPERIAVPGYDARKTATPESCREGRTLRIALPATPRNAAATGHPCEPHAAGKFNDTRHEAVLTAGGAELLRGPVRLLAATDAEYTLEIRSGGAGWAENAARRMFNTLGVEYDGELTPTDIRAGWTDGRPVKFFPVLRDEYPARNGPSDLLPAERVLSPDDYHPFLHVATLAERIFAEAGYRVESRFFASEFFRSLYMSGAYPSHDTAAAEARMGFSARRTAPVTAKANEAGKVVADPATALNSVGNIVETATPQSTDADGNPIDGLYNHGGCFSTDGGRILFTPLAETTAGFEYRIRYTTSHRILSRTRLRGFDTVYLGPGSEMAFTLANRYEDHRAAPEANRTYRALVFDHREGARYRLRIPATGWKGSYGPNSRPARRRSRPRRRDASPTRCWRCATASDGSPSKGTGPSMPDMSGRRGRRPWSCGCGRPPRSSARRIPSGSTRSTSRGPRRA